MRTFHLKVSSPSGILFEGEVTRISLRGVSGDFTVMAGHIPFVTSVLAGRCKISDGDGETAAYSTDGGLLTVSAEQTDFFTSSLRLIRE